MRLADFILANTGRILAEWDAFARTIWPNDSIAPDDLRDHAEAILRACASNMVSGQSSQERSERAKGTTSESVTDLQVLHASAAHGLGRAGSGFDLPALISEYRALRASVVRLWRESRPSPDTRDLEDLARFNESIDQSLADAAKTFTTEFDSSRKVFLGILGHDLRNPLNSLVLSAQALRSQTQNSETLKMAHRIITGADVMAKLVTDLLDFTTTQRGVGLPIVPRSIDLRPMGEDLLEEFQAGNPDRSIRMQARGDLRLDGDEARLRQAASNLLGNALDHGSPTGDIVLMMDGTGVTVAITVWNEGKPIPPGALGTIFEPLVRGPMADPRARRRHGSAGLGLYIVKAIVAAHSGQVIVTSSVDSGTAFTITLPRMRRINLPPTDPSSSS